MHSIQLVRENLKRSENTVLSRIEEMRDHCTVSPTRRGGCHTLWVLGHLAYIEALVIRKFMLGESNPMSHWEQVFDAAEVSGNIEDLVTFDCALAGCRGSRASTIQLLDSLDEVDLDQMSVEAPSGLDDIFGTFRRCFQYAADHWLMHRGQLADARLSAGLGRMWY